MALLFLDHLFIRDYQIFQATVYSEERACAEYGIFNKQDNKWDYDAHETIKAFNHGLTGIPIVDACIRELILTGYITNRARQIIAGYLVLEMNCDWRIGLKLF
jgi:deoxyribodipyrimidine photo-lyase